MSNDIEKVVHGRRIQQKNRHIARQIRIRQAHKFPNPTKDGFIEKPHRYHKLSGVTCGSSHCFMCGNPRKFFKEPTMQEKRFDQNVDTVRDRHSNGILPQDE
jgi:hypothetical protein